MSLEDELKKEIWDAVQRDPKFMEARVTGEEVDAGLEDIVGILVRRLDAQEAAIFRLAREIDGFRA